MSDIEQMDVVEQAAAWLEGFGHALATREALMGLHTCRQALDEGLTLLQPQPAGLSTSL